MAEIIRKSAFETRRRQAEQDQQYQAQKLHIPKQYAGDIRAFIAYCLETEQPENGRALLDFLEVSMEQQRVKKTTWERRLVAVKRYLMVTYSEELKTDPLFIDRVLALRNRFKQEEHAEQTHVQGQSAGDKAEILDMVAGLEPRAKAICLVNLITANRPSEMVRLQVKDFDFNGRFVRVYLKKQKEWHNKRLTQEAIKVIKAYIRSYGLKKEDYFVGRVRSGGKYESVQISEVGYNKMIHRLLGFAPYTLRKTQVSAMHEKGADLPAIAKQTGHKSLETLSKHYLKVSDTTVDKYL